MITIIPLTFNPFQENMYILHDETNEAIVIDPGCYEPHEKKSLLQLIESEQLHPKRLLNTHCHIDHVFGNKLVAETYNLGLEIHENDLSVLSSVSQVAHLYGIPNVEESPQPSSFLKEGDKINFGNSELDVLFVPGHAPGHIAFVSHAQKFIIGGDVLFYNSIGRTDLPGGDHATLIESIKTKFFPLGDDYEVYAGHGQKTTIGFEKLNNPFLQ
ncbi:MBL fold metallo-hydrolase [Flavobacteriales bacterium]|jgi:glyoxylase-like metal-dependent hydrolase (beta-lactamase superfamily II)|nr:MBL fold metallo-hydrolase [Flavobacteriales bacterium]